MLDSLKSEKTVREYLLGRVSDETTLEGIEELLFTDAEFCSRVELAEDGLINDYVFGFLDEADAASFRVTLADNPERRFKLELTQALREKALAKAAKVAEERPSFFASLKAFFRQPKYVAAFTILLVALLVSVIYLKRSRNNSDELAELQEIYRQERPTETRIAEFGYAPLAQLRGAPEPGEKSRLRRIENSLIEATEKSPNARTHHSLGVFYLTQQNYTDAIREFESALKFDDKSARIHNDLGAAHFELSKTVARDRKFEDLARSLEEFTKAWELDGNLLEALFNKSLALQELDLPREAKESWRLYLQKDSSSPWADEARRNLSRLESDQTLFKTTDERILSDFLIAYRNHDEARAQRIHNETKGLLKEPALPLQLSRRYLLARQRGDDAEAKESLEALGFIGNFERAQNADPFFLDLANFYADAGAEKTERLLQAKDMFASGQRQSGDSRRAISEFEKSRDLFAQLGDVCEAAIAEIWAVQFLPDILKLAEGSRRLSTFIENAESRRFKVLLPPAYYWLGIGNYQKSSLSESGKNLKTALSLAEAGNNTYEIQHVLEALALHYAVLGELEPALSYASRMLPDKGLYYQDLNQSLRNEGTLANLSLSLKFFSTSLSLSKEKLILTEENWPDNSRRVKDALRHMIDAAAAKKDFAAALKYADDSMRIALKGGDGAENTKTRAEIYLLLADVKSKTKDCGEALTDYDKALELYRQLPELTVGSYQIHKGKLFCFRELNEQENFDGELKTVLALSDAYRSAIREDASRQAFFANEQEVFDAAIENAIQERDSQGAFALAESSRARSLLDVVESGKSIAEVERDFASVARPLSLEEIKARLPDQVQLVQYAVLPDKLAIWVVSKTRFDFIEKPITAADLEDKIDTYQASIAGKASAAEIKEASRELYELLIPPALSADRQLCLTPDKSLHQLAFATLVSPDGKYLLEDFALFYAPSASLLVLATENARRKEQATNESLLSIGNPDFDREENPNLPDLKAAETEAEAIAGGYRQSVELIGGKATKEKFLRNFANFEVVHFAGHFVANRQSPGNSKLLFAGGDLRSSELGAYKLPKVKLVIMSACQTGFERYNKSEGAIGIARTLLALGAPVVVASQWKVDSEPTKDLMIAFHRNRREKRMTSAESLRQAQLEVSSMDKTKAPFYWAAFSLFGGYANY
jgi:CHAT domain-containing protein